VSVHYKHAHKFKSPPPSPPYAVLCIFAKLRRYEAAECHLKRTNQRKDILRWASFQSKPPWCIPSGCQLQTRGLFRCVLIHRAKGGGGGGGIANGLSLRTTIYSAYLVRISPSGALWRFLAQQSCGLLVCARVYCTIASCMAYGVRTW